MFEDKKRVYRFGGKKAEGNGKMREPNITQTKDLFHVHN